MNTPLAIIPARLSSRRLPRKVLLDLGGRPVLWHTWSRVCLARHIPKVFVLTDAPEIVELVRAWGGDALLTSGHCDSGTERIASVIDQLPATHIVNVQADEPFVDLGLLDRLCEAAISSTADIITPVFRIDNLADLDDPNVVKVVRAVDGTGLYFSRSPIPHIRDSEPDQWLSQRVHWRHVGIYVYHRRVLEAYPSLPASELERCERLEQLRLLEAGFRFLTIQTECVPLSIDTEQDLIRARARLTDSVQYCEFAQR